MNQEEMFKTLISLLNPMRIYNQQDMFMLGMILFQSFSGNKIGFRLWFKFVCPTKHERVTFFQHFKNEWYHFATYPNTPVYGIHMLQRWAKDDNLSEYLKQFLGDYSPINCGQYAF